MLIKITEKCCMGCSHCMDDAKSDLENHMSFETFKKAVAFSLKYDNSIIISGGEPTEHPEFWGFLSYLADVIGKGIITICTNGMNLSDKDIEKVDALQRKCHGEILWQVSTIKPYYPKHIDTDLEIFKREDFFIARKLEVLQNRGRATEHKNWIFNSKCPQCFNIRSIMRSTKDFQTTIHSLRTFMKFCTPAIAYDGSIKLGESRLCPSVAHIDDSESEIANKLLNFTCKCPECWEILNKMSAEYRAAIGEK